MSRYIDRLQAGDHGNTSERRVAKKMGSRLQPASGALVHAKSDARLKGVKMDFRIESKATVNMTLPLQMEWLTKITSESMADSSVPAVSISFVDATGRPRSARNADWVLIPLWAFNELREAAERST